MRKLLLLLLAVILSAGCATVPVTGRRQLSFIPDYPLLSLSLNSYRELLSQVELSQDREKTAMVNRVGKRIAQATEDFLRETGQGDEVRNYRWKFALIQDDEVINAFCMPGGQIGVYTGMLPVARDEAGLAVVMGHEVAHAVANHGGERMSQMLLIQFGGIGLERLLEEEPQLARALLLQAYGLGASIGYILPYSRKHELEADYIGLILTARAGYDPREAVGFWQRMRQQKKDGQPPEFLSTHPATDRRIEEIKEKLPAAMEYYRSRPN